MDVTFASRKNRKASGQAKSDTSGVEATPRAEEQGGGAGVPLFLQRSVSPSPLRLQMKLSVGAPDSVYEREADQVAEQIVAGAPSTSLQRKCACGSSDDGCETCRQAEATVQRRAAGGIAPTEVPTVVHEALRSPGQPLEPATRGLMESRFGHDFGHVRVHTDETAARSAEALSAEAYTVGSDVVFGAGRYESQSGSSQKLLAHELTHVVQQSDSPARIDRQAKTSAATTQARREIDPCDVNVPSLTNGELVAQLHRARTYLAPRSRGEDDYYAYANLMRRLMDERRRRALMGHLWLAEELSAMPQTLYELRQGAGLEVLVLPADVGAEQGPPTARGNSPVLTPGQFQQFLERQGIPTMDIESWFARQSPMLAPDPLRLMMPAPQPVTQRPQMLPFFTAPRDETRVRPPVQPLNSPFGPPSPADDYYSSASMVTSGVLGSGLYTSPFARAASPFFSEPVYSSKVKMANQRSRTGAEGKWKGWPPEMSFGRGGLGSSLIYTDLNTLMPPNQRNFEVWDWRNRFTGDLISVTHTLPNQAGDVDWSRYKTKFRLAIGAQEPHKMTTALGRLNAEFGTSLTIIDANQRTYLAVNEDHVEQYRTRLRDDIVRKPGDYTPFFDGLLRAEPVRVGTATFSDWNSLQAARANGTVSATEFNAHLTELSRRASLRVISNGMTSQQILNMLMFRTAYQQVPAAQFGRLTAPELIEAQRFGGGSFGMNEAAKWSGRRGAGMGMVLTAGFDLAHYVQNPDASTLPQMGIDVGLAGVSGYGGSMLESRLNMSVSQWMLNQAASDVAAGGSGVAMTNLYPWARGASGAAVGGPVASLTTIAGMGIDDLFFGGDYTYIDYTAMGSRAFVSGAAAGAAVGWMAAAGSGAAAGSVVPGLGTVIGFIVGAAVYLIVDAIVGEDIESGVRTALGEGGCPRQAPSTGGHYSRPYEIGSCFTGETSVLMADGTSRAIAELSEGDEVLAFDVDENALRAEKVISLHRVASKPYLELSFTHGGPTLKVTAEHPFYSDGKWLAAASLKVGSPVVCATPDAGGVAAAEVTGVKAPEDLATVYNLSVSGCHTFFVEGVLVHNKNI